MNNTFMEKAIEKAKEGVVNGGGPFGAVIVDSDGQIVSEEHNKVTLNNDPTAHAEILAIRSACYKLGKFSLEGCSLYTSCEPCTQCFGAIYWARLNKVYYAADREHARSAGFDDAAIYDEINKAPLERSIPFHHCIMETATDPFLDWVEKENRTKY